MSYPMSSQERVKVAGTVIKASGTTRIGLSAPPCTVGITDGSERGDYVEQSHLLRQIGRPHHVVNLMFQYYPDMEGWPTQGVKWHGFYRNNNLNKGDGYFPLALDDSEPWGGLYLKQIADVRAHGQEPQLTLTLHADTPDEELVRIAQSLAPFAPMRIRINHECNGIWFYFNQRWSYKAVNDLFIRFHNILHTHAPGVSTVACWNGPGDSLAVDDDMDTTRGHMTEEQMAPMFRTADIVSFDQYASLHYGWPNPDFDPANPTQYFRVSFERWWEILEQFHEQIRKVRGSDVDVEIHEINEDADVIGLEEQARWTSRFYAEAARRAHPWLTNITFYHFRDRGGLGLEREDVNDPKVFTVTPALAAYRAAIQDHHFAYRVQCLDRIQAGAKLEMEWRSSTCATGFEFAYDMGAGSGKAALEFPADAHLLVNVGDEWMVKYRNEKSIAIPAAARAGKLHVRVLAPPEDGRNNSGDAFTTLLAAEPVVRIN